jgi:hypothetical protein
VTVFITGIGFRSAAGLTVRAPVTVMDGARRGIRVTRLAATDSATEVVFEVRDDDREEAARQGRVDFHWAERSEVWLRDEQGRSPAHVAGPGNGISMGQHEFGFFGQLVLFEPLAPDARRLTLEVRGVLGEWNVPLDLVPVTEADVTPALPIGAEQELHGVTLRVVSLAITASATIVEIEADVGPDATAAEIGNGMRGGGGEGFALVDGSGSRFAELSMRDRTNMRRPLGARTVVSFPPTESRALTVEIPAVVLQEREGVLEFDLPIFAPVDLMFGRYPMRIRYAAAVDRLAAAPGDEPRPGIEVQLDDESHDGRRVLRPGPIHVDGVHCDYSILGGGDPWVERINIPMADAGGARRVRMGKPVVAVRGPWRISFTRP